MIHGLNKFRDHFSGREKQYVLIGGTATYLVLSEAGLEPRATKDLDIVLCLEALDADFGRVFWSFIREGGYQNIQGTEGKEVFYRFQKPRNADFPAMIELLSRAPDNMTPPDDVKIARIKIDEDIYSLSAILLDNDYYNFLHTQKEMVEGVSVVNETGLIPLKAKAWLNLTADKKNDDKSAKSSDIRKHRADVLRLSQLLQSGLEVNVPEGIGNDLKMFLDQLAVAEGIDLNALGLGATKLETIIAVIRETYRIPTR